MTSSVCDGYFKTERFDRISGSKIFTTTFARLLEADFRAPSCDYETYQKLVRMLTRDNSADKEQLYRVTCFNCLTHNRDDHAKNFSFLYTNDSGWRLAPAYDLTYSDTYWGEQTTSVNGKGKNITDNDLLITGRAAGLSKEFCENCLDEIKGKTAVLKSYFEGKKTRKVSKVPPTDRIAEIRNKIIT